MKIRIIKRTRIPFVALMPVLLLLAMGLQTACTKKVVTIHPGAVSNLDSYSYDILLADQDVINAAVVQYKAGNLPSAAKDTLNGAIDAYNLAQAAWQGYHAAGGDSTNLQKAMDALVAAVGALQQFLNKTPAPSQPVALAGFEFAGGLS